MNKIINWVGGSFFRTIGRLLVYILLGFLLSILLTESKIKLPSIFNFLEVNAESISSLTTPFTTWNTNYSTNVIFNATSPNNDSGSMPGATRRHFSYTQNWNYRNAYFNLYQNKSTTESYTTNSNTYFGFVIPLVDLKTGYNYTIDFYTINATIDNIEFIGAFEADNANTLPLTSRQINSAMSTITNESLLVNNESIPTVDYKMTFDYSNNYKYITFLYKNNNSYSIIPNGSGYFGLTFTNNGTITNLNDINSSLTDDSINESGVSDFTNGLNQEYSSLTPFSDFLNLPLTWIQSLFASNQNCTAIHLPLPYLNNKYLDLPCMTSFWQQMGAISTLIQVVWIAIVGVRIFNGLFLLTCETIDPNPDKDMTKLRTWEL